jgi:hypothetical protein
MAAATMWLDRWHAGQRLMQSVDLEHWRQIVDADVLVRVNADAVSACRRETARTGKPKPCVIKVAPAPVNGGRRGEPTG